jgi:excisionase family DNA binding protein
MTNPLVLTVDQVAELLQVDSKAVVRLRNQRKIAFVKIGGKLRFRTKDIETYLQKAVQPCHAHNGLRGSDGNEDSQTGTSIGTTRIADGSEDAALALAFAARLKKSSASSSSSAPAKQDKAHPPHHLIAT